MRDIGIHLRLQSTIPDLFQKALELDVPIFQAFFVFQSTGKLVFITPEESAQCKKLRDKFKQLYVHGSYWINLADSGVTNHNALHRELSIAKRAGFTHMVLHPGSERGAKNREEGIDHLVRSLNGVLKNEREIQIVLENTAHGGMSLGGDWNDFKMVKEKLDQPERVLYCFDTAHAYSYGYDIDDLQSHERLLDIVDHAVGLESIALIHLNETSNKRGSKLDQHASIGHGSIGIDALKSFILNPRIKHVPCIMEPPLLTQEQEAALISLVQQWHEQ